MTDVHSEALIQETNMVDVDFTLYKDGSSMFQQYTRGEEGGIEFYHLDKVATKKLYAELFKAFGIPFTVPDDPKEP